MYDLDHQSVLFENFEFGSSSISVFFAVLPQSGIFRGSDPNL